VLEKLCGGTGGAQLKAGGGRDTTPPQLNCSRKFVTVEKMLEYARGLNDWNLEEELEKHNHQVKL